MTSPSQVTDGEMSQFKGLLTNAGLSAEIIRAAISDHGVAQAMVKGGKAYLGLIPSEGQETGTVTVPDLPANELIALARRSFQEAGIPLTYLDSDYNGWNFLLDERGKTFRVFTRNVGREWESEEARTWQKSIGADGNTAAFIAWVIKHKPMGLFTSIPNDRARLFRYSSGILYAPFFYRDGDRRKLDLSDVRSRWDAVSFAVAFSAI